MRPFADKNPQKGADTSIRPYAASFIRTIPSAPESHRLCHRLKGSFARGLVGLLPHYRRWGITPRPEDFLL